MILAAGYWLTLADVSLGILATVAMLAAFLFLFFALDDDEPELLWPVLIFLIIFALALAGVMSVDAS